MSITQLKFYNLGWDGLWVVDGTGVWHRLRSWCLPPGLPGWVLDSTLESLGLPTQTETPQK
jgi:hypothetical protein